MIKPMNTPPNPKRTVAELKELRALTADENGAQRVAFTPIWVKTRAWLRKKLEALPVEIHNDAAGNTWTTLRGESDRALLIGGHMDSVPNGGWLDGCLNVLAGVEILRRINAQYNGKPPVTVRLVDWADEEGARFGKSLFGSSACSGNLDMNEARGLVDKDGIKLPDALKNVGVDFERVKDSGKELKNAAAYLELHIEQGPVLAGSGFAARRGARHVWGRAARHHFSRPGRALRQHADEPPQGRLSRRRENESRKFIASPSAATAAFAPSAPARPSPASSPAWSTNAASRWTSAISTPPRWQKCCRRRRMPAKDLRRKAT